MNKKDYINAINEIKADERLKNKTIQKITNKPKHTYTRVKRMLSLAAIFVLVFSFGMINRKPKQVENETVVAKLPTIDNYDNLKNLIEKNNENNSYGYNGLIVEDAVLSATNKDVASDSNSIDRDYSTTNTQVNGVDEADIVKTNGRYIFYYRKMEKKISIVDAEKSEVVKTISYSKNRPIDMYLCQNRLVVVTNVINDNTKYKYDYRNMLKIICYDISNINDIEIVREVEVEGNLLTSRMIGDYIYIVSNKSIYSYMIEDEDLLKPVYRDDAFDGTTKCVEYEDIMYFPDTSDNNYMIISSFNVTNNKQKVNIQTYLGSGRNLYASQDNLYVTCTEYVNRKEFFGIEYSSYEDNTKLYKFSLKDGEINYVANTTIPGRVENQFSMDEYKGYFRIGTTHYSKETLYKDVNNLYVLDDNLNLVGQIENLAPGESIYSMRYMGDKAYMVTFEKVDPLFVLDLSNPKDPQVLGKLKIPGYSDYLHPYDETHIIGFGKDTETDGEFVKSKGMKMALFDVSDVQNPKELYSVKIGDSGTYSELLNNHKALLFSKEKNIIAFPISVREKMNDSEYYSKITFKGAIIYGLNIENGFEERARISSDSNKDSIDRIIYIEDKLYTLSEDCIKVIDINTMEELNKIEL